MKTTNKAKMRNGAKKQLSDLLLPKLFFSLSNHTYTVGSAHWPAGSYGIPKPASGCPYADGFQWLVGRRYQDTEDNNPNNHKSPEFHLDATVDSKKGIIRSFCMKTDTTTDKIRSSWPPGNTITN